MWAKQSSRGFTIVELLIVIVVIAILAAITIVAYNGLQTRSKVSGTNSSMAQLKKSMLSYKALNNELPPLGDSWNFDTNPPSCPSFITVVAAMTSSGITSNPTQDAWGSCFGYDDNDCSSGSNAPSNLVSAGPDKLTGTGDDISLQISAGC